MTCAAHRSSVDSVLKIELSLIISRLVHVLDGAYLNEMSGIIKPNNLIAF
jgi:hypothetical protein